MSPTFIAATVASRRRRDGEGTITRHEQKHTMEQAGCGGQTERQGDREGSIELCVYVACTFGGG